MNLGSAPMPMRHRLAVLSGTFFAAMWFAMAMAAVGR
jgi:hypothetical protein